ncbi:hypothetical protein ZEAMMB73_Zm00001d013678 [Zea mays]|uniref:Uncharacterized protein n=1 Tax=Zea mays TaxID=4577 RepID=A0A1D6GLF6_MAIZE|nr:hypothetical protein ZEAMMB73_Zm00001d013678 [Zea mays]
MKPAMPPTLAATTCSLSLAADSCHPAPPGKPPRRPASASARQEQRPCNPL